METYDSIKILVPSNLSAIDLLKKNDNIIKVLEKSSNSRLYKRLELPNYIIKNNDVIERLWQNKLKKNIIKNNRPENMYDYIDLIKSSKYKCSALTSNYKRCTQDVVYKINNYMNRNDIYFCKTHLKNYIQMLNDNKTTLKYGFFFDSDLYIC
jgi:hypothetical protein